MTLDWFKALQRRYKSVKKSILLNDSYFECLRLRQWRVKCVMSEMESEHWLCKQLA